MSGLELPADPRVLVGIDTADDAGVFAFEGSDRVLVQTADFITPVCDDPYWFGRVAGANSFSDIYAMGGEPLTALNLCCFPARGVDRESLIQILRGGLDAIKEAGAALVGGQSVKDPELKYGLAVTGIADRNKLTPNSGARVGERLILTKPIGTGELIGGYRSRTLTNERLMPAVRKMATLNATAAAVGANHGCRGATDITGFGLGGHAWEMASAANVKLVFYADQVPYYEDALKLVRDKIAAGSAPGSPKALRGKVDFAADVPQEHRLLFADPQTSGGLLLAVAEATALAALRELHDRGVDDAALVGHVEAAEGIPVQVRAAQ